MIKIFISTSPFGEINSTPLDLLSKTGWDFQANSMGRKLNPTEVAELAINAEGIIAGTENLRPLINKSSKLKIISRVGIGLDNVPLAECKERGITVTYTPDAVTLAVAELTIGAMICISRNVHISDRDLRIKHWQRSIGRRLGKSVIGLIGFGRVGSNVARLLAPFQPRKILINDIKEKSISINKLKTSGLVISQVTKEEIYKESDIISLHVPLTPRTRYLINSESLKLFKKDSVFINYSRGGVVNESDLYNVLKSEHILGAAIDAFEEEPYYGDLALLNNVLLTQHIGSCSFDCRYQMEIQATQDLIRFFQNEKLMNEVPQEEYEYQI